MMLLTQFPRSGSRARLVFYSLSIHAIILCSCDAEDTLPNGFVYLQNIVPSIHVDLRYYSTDNFVGDTVAGYHSDKCIITEEAANALQKVQIELESQGLGLLVFDVYRPQQAVDHFVRWAADLEDTLMKSQYYPDVNKNELFEKGYISRKSGHSRGSTVDLTIIYINESSQGHKLDMGTSFDYFSPLSWPASNEVSELQKANRMLLRKVMIKHGFKPLDEEWWHFTLVDEPFPETYFDFPIR